MNSFLHHKFYTMQQNRTGYKTVVTIMYAGAIECRTKHDDKIKLFRRNGLYKTPFCAKLSHKNFRGLIWSYVKLNILRKITHLAQKNPRKFGLIKREIVRYDEQAELQKMKVIWWKLPSHDQYNTNGHAILDSHAICWIGRGRGEVCSTPRSSP